MAELPGVDGYVASARMCREFPVAAHPSGRECVVYEQAQEHADPQDKGVLDLIALLDASQGRRAREQAQAAARLRRRVLLLGDATARVWDVLTGEELLTLKGHISTIFWLTDLARSRIGRTQTL